jgi:hypothetical protein
LGQHYVITTLYPLLFPAHSANFLNSAHSFRTLPTFFALCSLSLLFLYSSYASISDAHESGSEDERVLLSYEVALAGLRILIAVAFLRH